MAENLTKNVATSAEDAAKIAPRAEFRVFGHGMIDIVKKKMWDASAVLHKARKMPPRPTSCRATPTRPTSRCATACSTSRPKVGETPAGLRDLPAARQIPVPGQAGGPADHPVDNLKVVDAARQGQLHDRRVHRDGAQTSRPRAGDGGEDALRLYGRRHHLRVRRRSGSTARWSKSACCESENYAGMKKAVEALGIAAMPNTNYLKAAKRSSAYRPEDTRRESFRRWFATNSDDHNDRPDNSCRRTHEHVTDDSDNVRSARHAELRAGEAQGHHSRADHGEGLRCIGVPLAILAFFVLPSAAVRARSNSSTRRSCRKGSCRTLARLGIFVFSLILWLTESIPSYLTSFIIIVVA